jgi:peptidoglycan hydrolase-like protein with peptidoglycan-binding domain
MGTALVVAGCGKKSTDQANLSGTGFDSLSNNSELAQLPQASATNNQQSSVEVLPIEASPVTQSTPVAANLPAGTAETASAETLSYQQKIQTALKNAGLYNGTIDGKIGPATRKAIEAFQQQNGLKVDGKVGPKTWSVLESYLNGQPAQASTAQAPSAS